MTIRKCNLCGKDFNELDINNDCSFVIYPGYGSRHDCERIEVDLCCDCMDDLIEKCAISPVTAEYLC